MPGTVTIPLIDTESPAYSRTLVTIGDDRYLIIGLDPGRGLIALEKLPPEPVREVSAPREGPWPWRRQE